MSIVKKFSNHFKEIDKIAKEERVSLNIVALNKKESSYAFVRRELYK
jgi:hypothetical protein